MNVNMTCVECTYIESNVHIFRGNSKVTAKERELLYLTYNKVFNDSKQPNGCGACQRGVIDGLKKVYEKYCEELCKTKEQETQNGKKESQEIQTEDQSVPKTKRPRKSVKRTKD